MNGVVQGVSGKRVFFVVFRYECEKDLKLNQLSSVTVERIILTKEAKAPLIYVIPDETIDLDKG